MDTDANAHEWCDDCKAVYPRRCKAHGGEEDPIPEGNYEWKTVRRVVELQEAFKEVSGNFQELFSMDFSKAPRVAIEAVQKTCKHSHRQKVEWKWVDNGRIQARGLLCMDCGALMLKQMDVSRKEIEEFAR